MKLNYKKKASIGSWWRFFNLIPTTLSWKNTSLIQTSESTHFECMGQSFSTSVPSPLPWKRIKWHSSTSFQIIFFCFMIFRLCLSLILVFTSFQWDLLHRSVIELLFKLKSTVVAANLTPNPYRTVFQPIFYRTNLALSEYNFLFNFCRLVIEKFGFKFRLRYGTHTVRRHVRWKYCISSYNSHLK